MQFARNWSNPEGICSWGVAVAVFEANVFSTLVRI
jgi:hypothetical protein